MSIINLNKVVKDPIVIALHDKEYTINFVPNRIFLPFFQHIDKLQKGDIDEEVLTHLLETTASIFNLNNEGHKVTKKWVESNLSLEMIIELFTQLINAGNDMKATTKKVKKNS